MFIDGKSNSSSLFFCHLSNRYISKYRLFTLKANCYYKEDEHIPANCFLNNIAFESCLWQLECLQVLGYSVDFNHCKNHYLKRFYQLEKQMFPRICNGIHEQLLSNMLTDESKCELWPCLNPYSRCDGLFQCGNGIDELNCPSSRCGWNEFECDEDLCIPFDHIYEQSWNCSQQDPHSYAQRRLFYSNDTIDEYFSWKNKSCIRISDICIDHDSSMDSNVEMCSLYKNNIFNSPYIELMNINGSKLIFPRENQIVLLNLNRIR